MGVIGTSPLTYSGTGLFALEPVQQHRNNNPCAGPVYLQANTSEQLDKKAIQRSGDAENHKAVPEYKKQGMHNAIQSSKIS